MTSILDLLPIPFNYLAKAAVQLILAYVVPLIVKANPTVGNLFAAILTWVLTGGPVPAHIQVAGDAHADHLASNAPTSTAAAEKGLQK